MRGTTMAAAAHSGVKRETAGGVIDDALLAAVRNELQEMDSRLGGTELMAQVEIDLMDAYDDDEVRSLLEWWRTAYDTVAAAALSGADADENATMMADAIERVLAGDNKSGRKPGTKSFDATDEDAAMDRIQEIVEDVERFEGEDASVRPDTEMLADMIEDVDAILEEYDADLTDETRAFANEIIARIEALIARATAANDKSAPQSRAKSDADAAAIREHAEQLWAEFLIWAEAYDNTHTSAESDHDLAGYLEIARDDFDVGMSQGWTEMTPEEAIASYQSYIERWFEKKSAYRRSTKRSTGDFPVATIDDLALAIVDAGLAGDMSPEAVTELATSIWPDITPEQQENNIGFADLDALVAEALAAATEMAA